MTNPREVDGKKSLNERRSDAEIKVDDFYAAVENIGESTYATTFLIKTKINYNPTVALVAYDGLDTYSTSVYFWPLRADGRLSSTVLSLEVNHEGADGNYEEKRLKEITILNTHRILLFDSEDNILESALYAIDDMGVSENRRHATPIEASKFLGDVDLESIKPMSELV